ncbi:von Willebrand factor type A domain protein [Caulifigura coniformis]|uniref:von Willebrand factor type A domain protein n=1 Tax=Caulifigura coniformis TaxID=2527983 RepID=A0A517SI50_9PLAN|nr:vWA domain-containing protein [Caulifigura coniformis]QDT55801.1 von Willebrand factor type A domain protein [Caulifigura coniformis]
MASGAGPSWRGSEPTPGRGNAQSWRRPGTPAASAAWPVRGRWIRAVGGLISTAIAIAAIATFIFLVFVPGCSETQFAVLAPAPYNNAALPPSPFSQQDREAFRADLNAASLPEQLSPSSSADAASSSKQGPLFIYVSAMAGRTGSGVVLYTMDSGPDDADGTIPIEHLWKYLAATPAERKKIVAIDIARGPVDERWGLFIRPTVGVPDGSGSLQLTEEAAAIPNLAVITSAAPGELSWSSPAFARSVFAQFLVRALKGDADGAAGEPRDYRVSLEEVHAFLLKHVNHWVLQNRDTRGQHPLLLFSKQADSLKKTVLFEVHGRPTPTGDDVARQVDGALLKRLEALWDARDQWAPRTPAQNTPLEWQKFHEHLRRAEQWRLAGQLEGMTPHLDEAESALRDLTAAASRNPAAGLPPFLAAGLSRRGTFAPSVTDPPLPEVQLEAALKSQAPQPVSGDARAAAVALRASAEQAAWQTYRAGLWTGGLLPAADRDRRIAEDLLFVGNAADLDRARLLRGSASERLDAHSEIVRELSTAHALHSRLLSELPALAAWAAERMPVESLASKSTESRRARLMNDYAQGIDESRFRPPSLSDQRRLPDSSDDASLQQTETDLLLLFEQTRQLGRLLDRELAANSDFASDQGWKSELQTLRQQLTDPDRGLDGLQARLLRHAKGLIGATVTDLPGGTSTGAGQPQYFHWLRLRNALQWNGLPADLRRSLFTDLEQSDRTLHVNSQKVPVGEPTPWNGDDWTGVDGCWRSLWALQTVSLGLADASMHEHWVDWKNAVVDPAKQINLLVNLGQSVRQEYRQRVERAQPSLANAASLKEAEGILLAAVRAERTFHGDDAVLLTGERDPLRSLQRFDLAATCLEQAGRYADDFWGTDGEKNREPWFALASGQCLQAAGRLSESLAVPALATARAEAAQRLENRRLGKLELALPSEKVDLTLTSQRPTSVTVERNDKVPPGVAAVWLISDPATGLDAVPPTRLGVEQSPATTDWTIRKQQAIPSGPCGDVAMRPRLYFRGRFWDHEEQLLRINPCPPDSLDFEYLPHAPTGQVVVFGADRRDTIFILDCSLSMADPMDPKNKQGETRFQAARKALSDALRVLRDSPTVGEQRDPYVVGLMAYGHRARTKGGDYLKTETNPDWKSAIPAAVSDDWRNDFELLTSPSRLVDDRYQQMIQQIGTLQPYGQTPLLGAISFASRTLLERQRGGVVVAITDGAYNDEKREGPRFKALQDLLQNHPELSLHVVAFGVEQKLELDLLTDLATKTQGQFYSAPTGGDLARTIGTVMKPRQYSLARSVEPREEQFADLGSPIVNRPPRSYEVRFPGLASSTVTLYGGEQLQFDLDFVSSQLRPRRPPLLLFRRAANSETFAPTEPTRFGYLRADYDGARKVATLELGMDRDDLLGAIDRPAEIRLDIVSRAARQNTSRSWKLSPDRSIPAWQVELKAWEADAQPEIQAIWKMTRTPPDQQVPFSKLIGGPQQLSLPGWPEKALVAVAERQPGKVLVRLQADRQAATGDVAGVRVELGRESMVEKVFLPMALPWRSRLFETERQITYEFDVGDGDLDDLRISFTSSDSLDRDARRLQTPLVIEKWDREL